MAKIKSKNRKGKRRNTMPEKKLMRKRDIAVLAVIAIAIYISLEVQSLNFFVVAYLKLKFYCRQRVLIFD